MRTLLSSLLAMTAASGSMFEDAEQWLAREWGAVTGAISGGAGVVEAGAGGAIGGAAGAVSTAPESLGFGVLGVAGVVAVGLVAWLVIRR